MIYTLFRTLFPALRSHRALILENLALRHQLDVPTHATLAQFFEDLVVRYGLAYHVYSLSFPKDLFSTYR
jgi:hypothetical protein